jgi:Phosphodiester glycosidase
MPSSHAEGRDPIPAVPPPPAPGYYTAPVLDNYAADSRQSNENRINGLQRVDYQRPQRPALPPRRRRRRWRRRLIRLILLLVVLVILLRQANGSGGAFMADVLRRVIGPTATARVEATFLDLSDRLTSVKYQLGLDSVHSPWTIAPTPGVTAASTPGSTARAQTSVQPATPIATAAHVQSRITVRAPMPLPALHTVVSPALPGEGIWTLAGLPASSHGALPPVAKTFYRPDPARPYALATILQFDLRASHLHIVAGIDQPSGAIGRPGSGLIPTADTLNGRLLGVLNGGFKYADGAYGLMSGGTVYLPPVWGAATIAVTRGDHVIMGSWGLDHRLTGANSRLVAWRQNAGLLIDHGHIASRAQDASNWGLSIMNDTYTWRSAIGLSNHGTLLYVAGNSLSAATMAKALLAAGAVSAMQLDINPFWVRAFTYTQDAYGRLIATSLDPAMPGTGMEYLYGDARDFFYLTRANS